MDSYFMRQSRNLRFKLFLHTTQNSAMHFLALINKCILTTNKQAIYLLIILIAAVRYCLRRTPFCIVISLIAMIDSADIITYLF